MDVHVPLFYATFDDKNSLNYKTRHGISGYSLPSSSVVITSNGPFSIPRSSFTSNDQPIAMYKMVPKVTSDSFALSFFIRTTTTNEILGIYQEGDENSDSSIRFSVIAMGMDIEIHIHNRPSVHILHHQTVPVGTKKIYAFPDALTLNEWTFLAIQYDSWTRELSLFDSSAMAFQVESEVEIPPSRIGTIIIGKGHRFGVQQHFSSSASISCLSFYDSPLSNVHYAMLQCACEFKDSLLPNSQMVFPVADLSSYQCLAPSLNNVPGLLISYLPASTEMSFYSIENSLVNQAIVGPIPLRYHVVFYSRFDSKTRFHYMSRNGVEPYENSNAIQLAPGPFSLPQSSFMIRNREQILGFYEMNPKYNLNMFTLSFFLKTQITETTNGILQDYSSVATESKRYSVSTFESNLEVHIFNSSVTNPQLFANVQYFRFSNVIKDDEWTFLTLHYDGYGLYLYDETTRLVDLKLNVKIDQVATEKIVIGQAYRFNNYATLSPTSAVACMSLYHINLLPIDLALLQCACQFKDTPEP